jgi:hypothetical protein
MVRRLCSGVRQILKLPRLQEHVAPNGLLPWINHYRLAGSAVFLSINHRMSTNAKKLDMATVMDQSDIKGPMERFREHFTKKTLNRPLIVSCLEDSWQPNGRSGHHVAPVDLRLY